MKKRDKHDTVWKCAWGVLLAFYRRGGGSGEHARVWRPSEQTRALAAFAIRLRTTK